MHTGAWDTGSSKDGHKIMSDPAKTKCDKASSYSFKNLKFSSCRNKLQHFISSN